VRPRSSSSVEMSEAFADATSQSTLPTRVSDTASLHPLERIISLLISSSCVPSTDTRHCPSRLEIHNLQ
jgi:hypothetical protein